ncbi:Acyl-CoA dehydrogenase [Arboricoccus pini]|uniref:Acyl-CoA dehydrogenase n=1 Tax=Arboricoccus pini TaxID=1963835 RepID=A0A212PVW6_9PROT|nr:acyl-CoA dehydrogenase family protein [Arboricoccus pini]SNB51036.1 Acyl-CoA dehydrogenase [Arboricoccus pini]
MQHPVSSLRASPAVDEWQAAARHVAEAAMAGAAELDQGGAFPAAEVAALAREGLLLAPFPVAAGGAGLWGGAAQSTVCAILRIIGRGSLPLGRLYEGHVNAAGLIARYGNQDQIRRFAAAARDGALFGVWNTEPANDGLVLYRDGEGWRLEGRKILASGAGWVERPLVTARLAGEGVVMVIPKVQPGTRADLSAWQVQGMRASATGSLDFTGMAVDSYEILGRPGDYVRQPAFSGGAWRFAAVQTGGIEAVVDAMRAHLVDAGRLGDPHQQARLSEAAMAAMAARLWVERAAAFAEAEGNETASVVALVNLARLAVEQAGLEVIHLAQRSVGLASFLEGRPLERLMRDLAVYLRQPKPDEAKVTASIHVGAAPGSIGDLW